jgi:hypothetical protein
MVLAKLKTKPSSFCTICTANCSFECIGLLLSLSLFHPNATIYIICDSKTKQDIDEMTPKPRLNIVFLIELDKYTGMGRREMLEQNCWTEFQMMKARVMTFALESECDTLLLDSDIIITGEICDIDDTKELGVSPQFIRQEFVEKTGYYNGGMLWTKNKNVPADWIRYTAISRYFDQASIEDLVLNYSYFEFDESYNIQCWRLTLSNDPPEEIARNFSASSETGLIYYKECPIKFIHTHFNDGRFNDFNTVIIRNLMTAKNYKILAIIFRVVNRMWVLTIPKQPMIGWGKHNNDSYRELPILMKLKNKDVDLQYSEDTIHCWLAPNILTYDRDTLEWFETEAKQASLILLGNCDVNIEGKQIQMNNVKPWIFWPRRPMLLEKILKRNGILLYDDRTIESIFIGNYENPTQAKFRNTGIQWDSVIEEYHCTKGTQHKFTHEEYLMKLRNAKYGLCLRGYGSKCHREVELMAFGTVPIVTDGVTTDSYIEPLQENKHFLRVSCPDEIRKKIDEIDEEKWRDMSNECYEWYQRNVYSTNCWNNMISYVLYS